MLTICAQMLLITTDSETYRQFISQESPDNNQATLNLLSQLLDFDELSTHARRHFAKAFTQLARKSAQYPEHLKIKELEVQGWVASGGFSDVWKGCMDGQAIAIKRPRISLWEMKKFLQTWSREIVLWSQLSHPNVLPLYGIYHMQDLYDSPICMVSPWMSNGNILQFLQVDNNVNHSSLLLDIATGLEYIHAQSIIHGDLKGANILITPLRRACITDFGLSTITASQIPMTTTSGSAYAGGTLAWQAPEVISPDNPTKNTPESDVYSFACVCYEVFTGKPPFCESAMFLAVTIMLKVLAGERPARPSSAALDDTIWQCMTDCWKQNPKERLEATEIVRRLTDTMPPIFPPVTLDSGWDEPVIRKLRASLHDLPLIPSLEKLQKIKDEAYGGSGPFAVA
ncbi:kinase-like domain-containing protein [Mycena rebaudengoi]|nr:kinase-like domain-containing protein [Mycena rebaudengoi]